MPKGPLRITRAGRAPTVRHLGPGTLDFHFRSVRVGKRVVMEELAPRAIAFEPRLERAVVKWQLLTRWQRRFVTLDDLATETGLTKGEFFAAVVRAAFESSSGDITNLLVACAFPSVVAAAVKRAKSPNGLMDCLLLLEHMNAYSTRKAIDPPADEAGRADTDPTDSDDLGFLRTGRVDR